MVKAKPQYPNLKTLGALLSKKDLSKIKDKETLTDILHDVVRIDERASEILKRFEQLK
jgi:hypothetical protein